MDNLVLLLVVFWFFIGLGTSFTLMFDRRDFGDVVFALLMVVAWPVLIGVRLVAE